MSKSIIGTDPDQCPTNADLGTMAFQDAESVRVGGIKAVTTGFTFPDGTTQTTAATSGGSLLVAETVVSGSAVTSVTFSGLDGDAAGGYILVASVKDNNTGGAWCQLFVNGDTTATNYYSQIFGQSGSTQAVTQANDSYLCIPIGNNVATAVVADIVTTVNRDFYAFCRFTRGTSTGLYTYNNIINKTSALAGAVTSLTITYGATDGIAVGSTFRLYKRK